MQSNPLTTLSIKNLKLAVAIRERIDGLNRDLDRITGAQAAHVVDIVCGIETAFREGCRVQITSEFPQPAPMDWAK